MAWTRTKALKDVSINALAQYSVLAITVLRGLLFTKFLGPEGFGEWYTIYFFFTFGQYSHLGLLNSVIFLAPESKGKGDDTMTQQLLSSAFTWITVFGVIFLIGMSAAILSGESDYISANWLTVLLASIAAILFVNFNFSIYRLQLEHDFKRAGILQILLAVTDLCLSFMLIMFYGLPGAFTGMLISLLIFTPTAAKAGLKNLSFTFDKNTFKKLFDTGFRILIVSLTFAVFSLSDKLSVTNFFTKTDMGYFSNAVSFAMLPYTIALALSSITTQRMLEEYGKSKSLQNIKIFLDENIFAVAFVIPLLSVLLIAFAEPAIHLLLPKYAASLRFVDKLSIGVYFLAISMCCYSFLLIQKRYVLIFTVTAALALSVFTANHFLSQSGYDVLNVSYVTVIVYFIFCFILYHISYLSFYPAAKITGMFIRLAMPVLPIIAAFSVKFYLLSPQLRFSARLAIALLWATFAYYYLTKKTTILAQLIEAVRRKVRG